MVFICCQNDVCENLVGQMDVIGWLGIAEGIFNFLCILWPVCFVVVCVGASVLLQSEFCFCI